MVSRSSSLCFVRNPFLEYDVLVVMDRGTEVKEVAERYRRAAEEAGDLSDPREQNAWADEVHHCYKLLRATEEGRAAIMVLMSDPSPHVRVWAAAHSLAWDPERARSVLEKLRDSKGPEAFTARWTLRQYEKGKLSFEY